MCLGSVDEKIRKPRGMIAYKAVYRNLDGTYTPCVYSNYEHWQVGETYEDTNEKWSSPPCYRFGFHCHTNRKDAHFWCGDAIIKVKVDEITASGYQFRRSLKCVVARKITILGEVWGVKIRQADFTKTPQTTLYV